MSQDDLDNISKNGLRKHIRDGGTPPNEEYVKAFQKGWKRFAEHRDVRNCGIQNVMDEQCYVVKHDRTRIFLAFSEETGESFTGYRLTEKQSLNHERTHTIGKNYKK
jgi:hypothetical protein